MLSAQLTTEKALLRCCDILEEARSCIATDVHEKIKEALNTLTNSTNDITLKETLEEVSLRTNPARPWFVNRVLNESLKLEDGLIAIGIYILGTNKNSPEKINSNLLSELDQKINKISHIYDLTTTIKLGTSILFKDTDTFVDYSKEITRLPFPYNVKITVLNNISIAKHLDNNSFDSPADMIILDEGLDLLYQTLEEKKLPAKELELGIIIPSIFLVRLFNKKDNMVSFYLNNKDKLENITSRLLEKYIISDKAAKVLEKITRHTPYPSSDPFLLGVSWSFFSAALPTLETIAESENLKISQIFDLDTNIDKNLLGEASQEDSADLKYYSYDPSNSQKKFMEFLSGYGCLKLMDDSKEIKSTFIRNFIEANNKELFDTFIAPLISLMAETYIIVLKDIADDLKNCPELIDRTKKELESFYTGKITFHEFKNILSQNNNNNLEHNKYLEELVSEFIQIEEEIKDRLDKSGYNPDKGLQSIKESIAELIENGLTKDL